MIKELIRLASHLDAKGFRKEADYLDAVIRKIADELSPELQPGTQVIDVTLRNVPMTLQQALMSVLMSGAYNCESEQKALRNRMIESNALSQSNLAKHWPDENSDPSEGLKNLLIEKGSWPESCNVQTDCANIKEMMGQLSLTESEYPNPCTSQATYDKLQIKLKEIIGQQ